MSFDITSAPPPDPWFIVYIKGLWLLAFLLAASAVLLMAYLKVSRATSISMSVRRFTRFAQFTNIVSLGLCTVLVPIAIWQMVEHHARFKVPISGYIVGVAISYCVLAIIPFGAGILACGIIKQMPDGQDLQ